MGDSIDVNLIKELIENEKNNTEVKFVNSVLEENEYSPDKMTMTKNLTEKPDANILVITGTGSDGKGHIYLDR